MNKIIKIMGLFFCFYAVMSNATEKLEIEWENLVPQDASQEDPLERFSKQERESIEWIIYLRENLPQKVDSQNQEFYDQMNKALPDLMAKGIDIDKIIAERLARYSAVNTELDGQMVTLAGYLLPLDLSGNKVTDFLLVPYVGACIHAPPPPPNQIVHAVLDNQASFEVDKQFIPVSVSGKIKVKSLSKDLFLNDGSDNVNIGYSMSVEKIEDYKP